MEESSKGYVLIFSRLLISNTKIINDLLASSVLGNSPKENELKRRCVDDNKGGKMKKSKLQANKQKENEIVTFQESTKQPFGLCVERKLDNCTATFSKALTTEYCLNLIIFISVHGQVIQEVVDQGCPTNKPPPVQLNHEQTENVTLKESSTQQLTMQCIEGTTLMTEQKSDDNTAVGIGKLIIGQCKCLS